MSAKCRRVSAVVTAMSLPVFFLVAEVQAAKPSADITLDSVTVSSPLGEPTTVTLTITNNSSADASIETNVQALMCDFAACDLDTTTNECTVPEINDGSGSLGGGQTADFEVIFALDAGNYIFVAKAVGGKGGAGDRNQAVVTAVIP